MSDVIVLGGSLAGLSTALMLTRRGHQVTVVERDEPAPDHKHVAALEWTRPSTPQHRHSHVLLARGVQALQQELPDVLRDLLDNGANLVRMFDFLAPAIADRDKRPGDEDLVTLCVRRPVIDWALDRAVRNEGIPIVREIARDLIVDDAVVRGVVTESQTLTADLVVDASGRRSRVPRWLGDRGIDVPEQRSTCGCVYLTRAFTLDGPPPGPYMTGFGVFGPGDGFECLLFRGDDETYTMSLQVHVDDKDMLIARDTRAFDAIMRTLPWTQPWRDAGRPLTEVSVMAGLDNTSRRLLVDGAPLVSGLLQVGDSAATTNPTGGRGMSLALAGAQLLLQVMDVASGDRLTALDELRREQIDPFVEESWGVDERAVAAARHRLYGDSQPELPPYPVSEEVFAFLMTEREVWQRAARKNHLLARPDTVFDDKELVQRILAARATATPPPAPPVSRDTCLEIAKEAISSGRPAPAS